MRRTLAGLALGAAFALALVWATLQEARVACEVCLDFGGHSACREGSAASREDAVRSATTAACAVLSGGVTQGIACDQTPPRSVRCEER